MIYFLMPVVFVIAIICVAMEDKIKVNKAATAILSAILLWAMLLMGADSVLGEGLSPAFNDFVNNIPGFAALPETEQYVRFLTDFALIDHLGDVATTLFFVMGSMVIVELVDSHGGFRIITNHIHTHNKRRLLWIVCLLTFFLSSLLDNLATAIVMIAILRKFIPHITERWIFASMIVISANAGGSWSPIGDVTTILLWTKGNLTPLHQITSLFVPAFVCMLVPLLVASRFFKKGESWNEKMIIHTENSTIPQIEDRSRYVILAIGVLSLAMVPVFNELTGLPPFMGVLCGLAILWVYTDLMYSRIDTIGERERMSISHSFSKIDMTTIMFFFGILMSVAALDTAGQLQSASTFLDDHIHQPAIIAFILGLTSSFLDNVALVAGAIGMYPLTDLAGGDVYGLNFVGNGGCWTFLAYCCVTGGSILIIGSATGVAVMGLEKIKFMYYLKNFTLLALSGYVAGALTYIFIFS